MAGIGHYHLSVKSVGRAGRGGGRVASAAAAYRSGGVILKAAAYRSAEVTIDRATGEVFDYTRKQGVLETHILTPENVHAPAWARDRNRLWNAAERAEPRKNGRIATEIEVALPHTLSREQNRALVLGYAQGIADRYGIVADVAIHQGHDERNIHSHILFSHREITEHGFGDLSNRHAAEKGGREVQVAGIAAQPRDVEALRQEWGRHVNRALERAGQELRVDHRSYQRQGRDLTPTRYLGPRQSHPERVRLRAERAEYNERVLARRQERERQALDRTHREREQHVAPPAAPDRATDQEQAVEDYVRRLVQRDRDHQRQQRAAEIEHPAPAQQHERAAERDLSAPKVGEDPRKVKLRALDDAELECEAKLDRAGGGWDNRPLTTEEIARQMVPGYHDRVHHITTRQYEDREKDRQLGIREAELKRTEQRWHARHDAMNAVQRRLHDAGLWPDARLSEEAERHAKQAKGVQAELAQSRARKEEIARLEQGLESEVQQKLPRAEARLAELHQRAALARGVLAERLHERELARQRAELRWSQDRDQALEQEQAKIRQEWAAHPERAPARGLSASALWKEAHVHQKGWEALKVEDVALELSPTYAAHVAEMGSLKGKIDKARIEFAEQVSDQHWHERQRDQRWGEMSAFGKAMHWSGIYPDSVFEQHESAARQAEHEAQKATLWRGALGRELDGTSRKAEAALAEIKPAAVQELAMRRKRAELAQAVQHERQAERQRLHQIELKMERQRERYGLEPRYGHELEYGHALRQERGLSLGWER